ncbi:hypothetical protein O0I10_009990 [Lichtheimia ornata]|uniref:Uncharacterized protein n=1 Tax=Lichtheimia ornata TaxID=688661 RepID=A0AAD7UW16_9FUNG|nr:uncharacterized protein O0I10_009990 [Lichtheimia ornata]KAJ8654295.1 hypothetical protein O0I10_009990 [Lichtheimia ornata]
MMVQASCAFLTELSQQSSQDIFALPLLVNMLDDGTSGSNRIRISKQEHCTLAQWYAWMVLDLQSETC